MLTFVILELQQKLTDAELALDEAQRLANSERTRRRTLHNTLMVRMVEKSKASNYDVWKV